MSSFIGALASLVEPMQAIGSANARSAIAQSSLTTSSAEGKTGTEVSEQIKSQNKQNKDRLFLPDSISYPNGITVTSDGLMFVGSVTTGAIAFRALAKPIAKINPQNSETKLLVAPQTAIIASTSLREDEERGVLWACSPDVFPTRQADGTSPRQPREKS